MLSAVASEAKTKPVPSDIEIAQNAKMKPIREIALVSSGRRSGQSTTRWRSALRMYRGALRYWQTQAAS